LLGLESSLIVLRPESERPNSPTNTLCFAETSVRTQ
jgi:hypothetical protein